MRLDTLGEFNRVKFNGGLVRSKKDIYSCNIYIVFMNIYVALYHLRLVKHVLNHLKVKVSVFQSEIICWKNYSD